MRARRTRHSRTVAAVCFLYRITLWVYPPQFRRAFGPELVVTFRNRFEDVCDSGRVLDCVAFAAHLIVDWIRAYTILLRESRPPASVAVLGLSDDEIAHGCVAGAAGDGQFIFAAVGFVFSIIGWYIFFTFRP
jgi:hypothetical protein